MKAWLFVSVLVSTVRHCELRERAWKLAPARKISLHSPSVTGDFRACLLLTTSENTIAYHNALFLSPQILHEICFQFLLGPFYFNSQEKLKTMLMQNFGVRNKEHYGMLWYFWSAQFRSFFCPWGMRKTTRSLVLSMKLCLSFKMSNKTVFIGVSPVKLCYSWVLRMRRDKTCSSYIRWNPAQRTPSYGNTCI